MQTVANTTKGNTPAKPTQRTAKAAKPAKVVPMQPVATAAPSALLCVGKAFVCKAGGRYPQAASWEVVVSALPATREQLVAALVAAGCPNAVGFTRGRIKGGHLVPVA